MSKLLRDNKQLMKEYIFEKNVSIDLNKITIGSHKAVWWQCSEGHEWEATIKDRNQGNKCPYCSNRKVLVGYNDLVSNGRLRAEISAN